MPRVPRRLSSAQPEPAEGRGGIAGAVAEDALAGAAAGALATSAAGALLLAARRAGLVGTRPEPDFSGPVLDGAGVDLHPDELEHAAETTLHLAVGAAAGALFEVARRRLLPDRRLAVPAGAAWGLVVWAATAPSRTPGTRLLPPAGPNRTDQGANVLAHLLYGAALGALALWRPRRRQR